MSQGGSGPFSQFAFVRWFGFLALAAVFPRDEAAAQALPAHCSDGTYTCTAVDVTRWKYTFWSNPYGIIIPGWFDEKAELIDALTDKYLSLGNCSVEYLNGFVVEPPEAWMLSGNTRIAEVTSVTHRLVGHPESGCMWSWDVGALILGRRHAGCPAGVSTFSLPGGDRYCAQQNTAPALEKNQGECCTPPGNPGGMLVGNPVNAQTGNKFQKEVDYEGSGPFPLRFVRYYNSSAVIDKNINEEGDGRLLFYQNYLQPGWTASYFQVIRLVTRGPLTTAYAYRPDGRLISFDVQGTTFTATPDIVEKLSVWTDGSGVPQGLKLVTADDQTEFYNLQGRLVQIRNRAGLTHTIAYDPDPANARPISVTDSFGHTLHFGYGGGSPAFLQRLTSVTVPGGGVYYYSDSSVTHPDGTTRIYHYLPPGPGSLPTPYKLSGITDEAGVRYSTYTYDGWGRVTATEHAGGVNRFAFQYLSTSTTITDPLNQSRSFGFTSRWGMGRPTGLASSCTHCGSNFKSATYDANGNATVTTDFNNVQTRKSFDLSRNLETSRTEAYGTPRARTITTTWHPVFRLPDVITEPSRTIDHDYDANGNLLTRTVTDTSATPNVSRVWTYTYDSYGRVLTEDGPRTDVSDITTYTYYTCTTGAECGQVHTVTNAMGHVTTFNSYNAHGQPLSITDPNGVTTTLTYDARRRLTSRTIGTETTSFTYWLTGLLKRVTLPDASYLQYTYDDAHRLVRIEDGEGNRIEYTLDALGNRTAEEAYDPSGTLSRTQTQVFNNLGQLWKQIGAAGTSTVTTAFGYDLDGNQVSISAPLNRNTLNVFDELGRLKQVTDPVGSVTQFGYNSQDDLVSVTDPRESVTTYTYNGFGDLEVLASPDTGTTSHVYDAAGNLVSTTDARNRTGTSTYDSLNRLTQLAYPDRTVHFGYDAGTYGNGHLTSASDAAHSMSWSYDAQGRVVSKIQTVGGVSRTVSYGYTDGNVTSVLTPSGQLVSYGYSNGRVSGVSVNGTTLLDQVLYEPFGPIRGWTWGNSTLAVRSHDLDGRIEQIDSAGLRTYGYDDASRITTIVDDDNPALNAAYLYDRADRLTDTLSELPDAPAFDLSATSVEGEQPLTVTLNHAPETGYWLALARTGDPVTMYSKWIEVTPTDGAFVWNVTAPGYAGDYEVRLMSAFEIHLTSAPIAVSAPAPPSEPTLWASAGAAVPGASVTVRLRSAPGGSTDRLTLARVGAAVGSYSQWVYVGSGVTDRDWTVTMPTSPGDYEFRLQLNYGAVLVAASPPITVTSAAPVAPAPPAPSGYDANGNRVTREGSTYTTSAASNRLLAVTGTLARTYTYDAAGNVTNDGGRSFTYDDAGRLSSVSATGSATYAYNALGQRVRKTSGGTTLHFVYDEAGHLLGEYTDAGALIQETVWLGDIPVATLRPNGSGGVDIFHVHADHLNTPRRVSRPSDNVIVWRWDSDAFGATPATDDPDGDTVPFVYHLRFPGQYFDAESGLHYNYLRNYDPSTGRYVESDPVGLAAGVNTYGYTLQNPLWYVDPFGLDVQICNRPADLPFPLNQFNHWWVKTNTHEAGMGPMNGQVPAQEGRSDRPGDPVQTVDHSGQSSASNAQCTVMNNVDEDCVNKLIKPGQPLGSWTPFNQCNNFAWYVVTKCRKGPQIPPKSRQPAPTPAEKAVQSVTPKVPK
jgi:RHS repeat-associated protein